MVIPPDIIEAVRERVNFFEIVSDIVELKPSGHQFLGCCPFHAEKTPSFSVNAEQGLYNCFGCGAKGNIFNFVMLTKGMSFPESVRFLANKVGIEIPTGSAGSRQESERAAKRIRAFREAAKIACDVYQHALAKESFSEPAKDYLKSRGLTGRTAKIFEIGFAPSRWEYLLEHAQAIVKERGTEPLFADEVSLEDALSEIGLLRSRSSKGSDVQEEDDAAAKQKRGHYDMFRNRIIFPIARSDGATIAFGGRLISEDKDAPKYINSSESPIYHKSRSLFGLKQALANVRRTNHVYIVEGYMDVISLYQAGLTTSLATCGTSLTQDHAKVIKRLANRVSLVFDGDAAGRKAAARCFDIFLNSGIEVNVVSLPEGHDPDSLAQEKKDKELVAYFASLEQPLVEIFLEQQISEHLGDKHVTGDAVSAVAQGKIATTCAKMLLRVDNPVEQESLMRTIGERLGVSQDSLQRLMEQERATARTKESYRPRQSAPIQQAPSPKKKPQLKDRNARTKIEQTFYQLLVAVASEPQLAQAVITMPSVMKPHGSADICEFAVRVRTFVHEVAEASLPNFSLSDETSPERQILIELLQKHELPASQVISEAIRQSAIGGSAPDKLVREASGRTTHWALKDEVETIRSQEASSESPDEVARLAQEKLLKRRQLEQLSEEAQNSSEKG